MRYPLYDDWFRADHVSPVKTMEIYWKVLQKAATLESLPEEKDNRRKIKLNDGGE
jgi:hypothetical protein